MVSSCSHFSSLSPPLIDSRLTAANICEEGKGSEAMKCSKFFEFGFTKRRRIALLIIFRQSSTMLGLLVELNFFCFRVIGYCPVVVPQDSRIRF